MDTRIDKISFLKFLLNQSYNLWKFGACGLLKSQADDKLARLAANWYGEAFCVAEGSTSMAGYQSLTNTSDGAVHQFNSRVAELYGAEYASVTTAGLSVANIAAVGGVLSRQHSERPVILCDSEAHQSITGGLIFGGKDVEYIPRAKDIRFGISKPITAEQFLETVHLVGGKSIAGLVLTPQSYDGFRNVDEEEKIYKLCQKYKITSYWDAAWCAFNSVLPGFPPSLLNHCDIASVSLHKKALGGSQICTTLFKEHHHYQMFQEAGNFGFMTTSPSFPLLLTAEDQLAKIVEGRFDHVGPKLSARRAELARSIPTEVHPEMRVITASDVGATHQDLTHLLIHWNVPQVCGQDLVDDLAARSLRIAEKATNNTLLLLISNAPHDAAGKIISDLKLSFQHLLKNRK